MAMDTFYAQHESLSRGKILIHLVEDWAFLEEYGDRLGFYQLVDDGDTKKVEIRVLTGGCAFIKEFDSANDEALKEILDYCKRHRFVRLSGKVQTEDLFG